MNSFLNKKNAAPAIVLYLCVLFFCKAAAANPPTVADLLAARDKAGPIKFDYVCKAFTGAALENTFKGTVWQKGVRRRVTFPDPMMGTGEVIAISRPEGNVVCMGDGNHRLCQRTGQPTPQLPRSFDELLKQNPGVVPIVTGSASIDNESCTKVEITLNLPLPLKGTWTSKQCINANGIPLRIEEKGPRGSSTLEVSHVVLKPLSDALFIPPNSEETR